MDEFFRNQSDYLAFSGGVLVAFSAIAFALPRWRPGVKLPRVTWAFVLLLLTLGWWPVQWAGDAERRQIETLIGALAPTYAHELARAGHALITPETPPDDPILQDVLQLEREWVHSNPMAHDIYTMRRRADGRYVFIADADTDYDGDGKISEKETGARLGEFYDAEDSGLARAFSGQANFNPEVVNDKWGSWVGAWAPIYDAGGQIDAVVGIDYSAESWLASISAARRGRIVQLGLLLVTLGIAMSVIGVLQAKIAGRRRAELEHRKVEERWRRIFEQLPLAYVESDTDGTIVTWNPAAERIFGYRREEMVGKKNLDVIVAADAKAHVATLLQKLSTQAGPLHGINNNLTKDGRTVACEWFNAPVVGVDGQVVGVMSLAQDITERVSLEEQVRQSQKLTSIGQLAAGVAHDFNNILTVIQGHADLLLQRCDLPEDAEIDIERISGAAERAANLTRQLLTFSRKQAMFARPLDLNEVVADAANLLNRVIGATITIRCDLAPGLPAVEADPTMLDHAITNLALNARDAMPDGGVLTLATRLVAITADAVEGNPERRTGPAVSLTITDTGTGIEPEYLTRVFEPFFTTKEVGKGTGLGLAAVHGIVKQHHGWIEVNSAVGEGTCVEIFLPPSAKLATPMVQRSKIMPPPVRAEGQIVLLVEDERPVRSLARIALERDGFTVLEAEDGPGAEALWAIHKQQIALLLTDMVMPNGIGGRELAARFLRERPDLPVIYASGYSVELTAPDFAESPTHVFIQKPYLPLDLLAVVRRVLTSARSSVQMVS